MRCFGGCLFLHRVVVSSFFSSSSNNSTRSLDVIVVGRSKKPRKRVERLSPHLYKERDDSCLCAFGQNTTNKSFPPKNEKKHPLSFLLRVPSFSFPFPPFAQFRLKNRRKIEKYLRFGNGKEERMSSKPSARKQNTRKKKEKRTRANKKHTNACT